MSTPITYASSVERVRIVEVGPRDGLQNEDQVLAAAVRAELVRRLGRTGLAEIEIASFVSDARVPQMAGAEDVVSETPGLAAVRVGLVLNERGLERALAAGVDGVTIAQPLSESFARRNQGVGLEAAAEVTARLLARSGEAGMVATVSLSVAFGCPFEGEVATSRVATAAQEAVAGGAAAVILADTIGAGCPSDVRRLLRSCRELVGAAPLGLHLHNTRNAGYANAVAGLEEGVCRFDASVGGIGGCPFAPGATGNVATEDLTWLLEREGASTGVDLDELCATARWLGALLGRELPGQLPRAGPWPATRF